MATTGNLDVTRDLMIMAHGNWDSDPGCDRSTGQMLVQTMAVIIILLHTTHILVDARLIRSWASLLLVTYGAWLLYRDTVNGQMMNGAVKLLLAMLVADVLLPMGVRRCYTATETAEVEDSETSWHTL